MIYDTAFFEDNVAVAGPAAAVVMPWVIERTKAHSVIDVGCGPGTWLSVAKSLGCEVQGYDGYAPDSHLLIDQSEFTRHDLTEGIDCHGFDLAMSLEVAEHLPESSAAALVAGLCRAPYVFWSAAIPGQNGVNHINEQWPSWWAPYFAANGYYGSCDIRRVFWDDRRIAGYYRQNFIIWSTPTGLKELRMNENVIDEVHPDRALGF